jgi:hypothetical protein
MEEGIIEIIESKKVVKKENKKTADVLEASIRLCIKAKLRSFIDLIISSMTVFNQQNFQTFFIKEIHRDSLSYR